jgi:hypothetical protein
LSIFSRFSKRRRSTAVTRPASVVAQPATARGAEPAVKAQATATLDVHRHADCPVKHRSSAAAARCRNS